MHRNGLVWIPVQVTPPSRLSLFLVLMKVLLEVEAAKCLALAFDLSETLCTTGVIYLHWHCTSGICSMAAALPAAEKHQVTGCCNGPEERFPAEALVLSAVMCSMASHWVQTVVTPLYLWALQDIWTISAVPSNTATGPVAWRIIKKWWLAACTSEERLACVCAPYFTPV